MRETPLFSESHPSARVDAIVKKMRKRVDEHDFDIERIVFEDPLESLKQAIARGEEGAMERLSRVEHALDTYLSAKASARMQAADELKREIGELSMFTVWRKKAA